MNDMMHGDFAEDRAMTDHAAKLWARETIDKMTSRHRLAYAIRDCDREGAVQIMAAALDDLGAGMPEFDPFSRNHRADAEFWADIATPPEIEAYAGVCLRKIERASFAIATRKRLLVQLWGSLTDDDRTAFLKAIDPDGKFRGKQ